MEERSKLRWRKVLFSIFAVLLFVVGSSLYVVTASSSTSGTADLPNGIAARVNGPFSCSCNTTTTEIEAGGHVFAFSPTTIFVDSVAVGPLDQTVTDVQIDATFWSASLSVNGRQVVPGQ